MKKLLRGLFIFLLFILLIAVATIQPLDRTPVKEQSFYKDMMLRLDSFSIETNKRSTFSIGTSKISLTPDSVMDLAGYGARKPKSLDTILDSIFVRTIVIKNTDQKVAIVTADLLIIHPKMRDAVYKKLKSTHWNKKEIFFTATHTHSSIGQWAPGLVGGLFAGDYEANVAELIAEKFLLSIATAEKNLIKSQIGFTEANHSDLVSNRLVQEKGIIDPYLKHIVFNTTLGKALFTTYAAHATCLNMKSRGLSGDFPGVFNHELTSDTSIFFSQFAAGAVGSMSPHLDGKVAEPERYLSFGKKLSRRIDLSEIVVDSLISISTLKIPLPLGSPQFKIAKDLSLRPYLFYKAFGKDYSEISVLKLNQLLLVGTPCDFSGELAVPLYEYAQSNSLDLFITSFNGGYIGYVTKDSWYDLNKYETRTMNWFGPGNGVYFSEVIKKIIDAS